MINHKETFFNPLLEKLEGKCEFGIYRNDKPTYLALKAANGTEINVIVTTRFNPKNTVRLQFTSQNCTKQPAKKLVTESELNALEKALNIDLEINNPQPSEVSHNPSEYTYHKIYFPFADTPADVLNEVSNTLIKIFNTLTNL